MGCDEQAKGCKACAANQTVCANGRVQTCDATGSVISSQACPLGCFENEPRCRDIDPSNGLALYLDMVANPQDLTLSGTLDTSLDAGLPIPSFLVPAPVNGVPVRVVVARNVMLRDIDFDDRADGVPALAIVASGDIEVAGTVNIATSGSADFSSGGVGDTRQDAATPIRHLSAGSGGGGHATAGGRGGGVDNTSVAPGTPGAVSGTKALVPLRGGCGAGAVFDEFLNSTVFPQRSNLRGGGAIQLSSRTKIRISGSIVANGSPGETNTFTNASGTTAYVFGGGAGGGILLEAPTVELGLGASLHVLGGGGGGCNPVSAYCAAGGSGATVDTPAGSGGNSAFQVSAPATSFGGAGGGGLGRIRVNTATATYTKSSSSVENGDISTGTLSTR